MKKKTIYVSGLLNFETILNVKSFPINYFPIDYPFFGINSVVSGTAYNISKALQCRYIRLRFKADRAGALVAGDEDKAAVDGRRGDIENIAETRLGRKAYLHRAYPVFIEGNRRKIGDYVRIKRVVEMIVLVKVRKADFIFSA